MIPVPRYNEAFDYYWMFQCPNMNQKGALKKYLGENPNHDFLKNCNVRHDVFNTMEQVWRKSDILNGAKAGIIVGLGFSATVLMLNDSHLLIKISLSTLLTVAGIIGGVVASRKLGDYQRKDWANKINEDKKTTLLQHYAQELPVPFGAWRNW